MLVHRWLMNDRACGAVDWCGFHKANDFVLEALALAEDCATTELYELHTEATIQEAIDCLRECIQQRCPVHAYSADECIRVLQSVLDRLESEFGDVEEGPLHVVESWK